MVNYPIPAQVWFNTWGQHSSKVLIYDETPKRFRVEVQEEWIDGRAKVGDIRLVPKSNVRLQNETIDFSA